MHVAAPVKSRLVRKNWGNRNFSAPVWNSIYLQTAEAASDLMAPARPRHKVGRRRYQEGHSDLGNGIARASLKHERFHRKCIRCSRKPLYRPGQNYPAATDFSSADVGFRGQSGHYLLQHKCPLMTQSDNLPQRPPGDADISITLHTPFIPPNVGIWDD
jgi:hypothetical protein